MYCPAGLEPGWGEHSGGGEGGEGGGGGEEVESKGGNKKKKRGRAGFENWTQG